MYFIIYLLYFLLSLFFFLPANLEGPGSEQRSQQRGAERQEKKSASFSTPSTRAFNFPYYDNGPLEPL